VVTLLTTMPDRFWFLGIPASVTSFAEGEVSKPIVATDLDPKELPPGVTREEILTKIVPPAPAPSHAKGTAGLVGLFVKPN
jgi:hypothetical protein